ncbi:hypothetical protein [Aldersonia kunmingensis]|uniref:hypothetical protein n=1 Tax=Aldersonia kunmingensis TaxID=408066 RepID=UPI000A6BD7DE|nr:hypothetical protein [Aldersonia kunmingensis]
MVTTGSGMDAARTSLLTPEIRRRGIVGQPRIVWMTWLATAAVGALVYFAHQTMATLIVVVVTLLAVFAATYPFAGRTCVAVVAVDGFRERRRRRRGEHVFWPGADIDAYYSDDHSVVAIDHGYDPTSDPGWAVPVPLGRVAPLMLRGTGFDDLFVLYHKNPGERAYLSVLLSIEGLRGGLRSNAAYASAQAAFGRVLAQLAKNSSYIRGVQLLHRSVPYDTAPHTFWYTHRLSPETTDALYPAVLSYDRLIEALKPLAEEHRSFLVVKIPMTKAFRAEAIARGAAPGSWASIVNDELERLEGLLRGAGMGRVLVLGEQRTCAVLRALQDPSFPIDKHQGVTWDTCWQHYIGFDDCVRVNGCWHTAVAHIPSGGIEPTQLGPLWLSPLLTGVEADRTSPDAAAAATIRTVSVRIDLIPAIHARAQARLDRTHDAATQLAEQRKGQISDGTSEVMRSSSEQRATDLMPGSGHHGLVYAITVSVTGRSVDDLRRARGRVEEAAAECAITELRWTRRRHDVTAFATYPLARGMAETTTAVRI